MLKNNDTVRLSATIKSHVTNTHGTFLSSQSRGKCRRISSGSVSAAITMNSLTPRFRVLVASLAPFFNCL